MRHKGVKLGVFIAILIVTVITTLLIIDSLKTSTLLVYVTPLDATITIEGEQYSNGNYRLFPKDQPVVATISKDGYESKEISLNLDSNKTTTLYTYLPCDNGKLYCYLQDTDSYNLLKYLNNDDDSLNKFLQEASIINLLPIHIKDLTISLNAPNSKEKIYLDATDISGENKNLVSEIIKQSGFNVDDYHIDYIYNETKNPYIYGFGKKE